MRLKCIGQIIVVSLLAGLVLTCRAETEAEKLFQQAQASYDAEQYDSALTKVQQAVAMVPDNSSFQHLLGKCYGRLAEQSNFLAAYSLAKKTRKALERAVELDGNNVNALQDLMEYYRQAPGFLGGSKEKAAKIQERLETINTAPG